VGADELDGAALRDLTLSWISGWAEPLRTLVSAVDPATVASAVGAQHAPTHPVAGRHGHLLGDAIRT
jgi:hypothetical protein